MTDDELTTTTTTCLCLRPSAPFYSSRQIYRHRHAGRIYALPTGTIFLRGGRAGGRPAGLPPARRAGAVMPSRAPSHYRRPDDDAAVGPRIDTVATERAAGHATDEWYNRAATG